MKYVSREVRKKIDRAAKFICTDFPYIVKMQSASYALKTWLSYAQIGTSAYYEKEHKLNTLSS